MKLDSAPLLWAAICSFGCSAGAGDPTQGASPAAGAPALAEASAAGGRPSAARPAPRLIVTRMPDAQNAEDGRGGVLAAAGGLAFDISSPPRAGAGVPELRVGELVLRRSHYPRPGVLRFVLAEGVALPEGAEVTLGQVGREGRVSLSRGVEVAR